MVNWKKILIRVGIAVVIFLISFTLITKFVAGSTKTAYLHIESGSVQVNTGDGYVTAADMMDLKEDYSVKTLADGNAVIVLYDSSFTKLEPNTEVSVAELSKSKTKISQKSGSTWSKFTGVTGMEGYEVETPTTVATVRGTEFLIDVLEDKLIVAEGIVGYRYGEFTADVNEFEKYLKGSKAELTDAERQMLVTKIESTLETMKFIRTDRMKRMRIVDWVRSNYVIEEGKDMTEDEQIKAFGDAVDKGEVDDRQVLSKVPLISKHPVSKQFLAMNDEIKNIQERLGALKGKLPENVEKVIVKVDDNNVVTAEPESGAEAAGE